MNDLSWSASDAMQHHQILSRTLLFTIGAVLVSACTLAEVEIPLGETVVVVHAVMRPDQPQESYGRQFAVVEKSLTGTIDYPYSIAGTVPVGGSPPIPIEGTTVYVTNLDYSTDDCSDTTVFSVFSGDYRLPDMRGVYWSQAYCPSMRSGDQLELVIETPEGDKVRGVTRLPGIEHASFTVAGDSLPFGTDSVTTVNRDRDTIRVHVDPIAGRLLQIDMLRVGLLDIIPGWDEYTTARLLVDTVSVQLPGDLADVFARGEGDDLLRAGRDYIMSVALTDTNYYDFTRSRNNSYTGRGFINRLSGGVGVFGSLVATSTRLHVIGDFDDPRDGVYQLRGTVQGVDVNATLTAYAYRSSDTTELSAFLDGDWLQERGGVWESWRFEEKSVDGLWDKERLTVFIYQESIEFRPSMMRVVLRGVRTPGESFAVGVADSIAFRTVNLGTLTATQQRDQL